jgi:hypothetical protein
MPILENGVEQPTTSPLRPLSTTTMWMTMKS